MVRVLQSKSVLLQTIFCSCLIVTTLLCKKNIADRFLELSESMAPSSLRPRAILKTSGTVLPITDLPVGN